MMTPTRNRWMGNTGDTTHMIELIGHAGLSQRILLFY